MSETAPDRLEQVYRTDARAALATLIRLLGDFDLAEEALSEAFQAAAQQWPREGMPRNPRAWLVSTGRFKAIDRLRRRSRFDAVAGEIVDRLTARDSESATMIEDDRLRLIFICCYPTLPPDAQIALALRSLCGLTTEEIARAFLVPAPTLAQRIVRAKAKIREHKIPYEVPKAAELPDRLEAVLQVIYLVFNEGYSASQGADVARESLCREAIRLGRELQGLLPDTETTGLLALMLLQDSRRDARMSRDGNMILLADQDRSLWDHRQIEEGIALSDLALKGQSIGRFTLQAAIAAQHALAPRAEDTDWAQIVSLYDLLVIADPSPVVLLNRAAAIAMHDGPAAGLRLVEEILERGDLADYHLAHAARADLCAKLGLIDEARTGYERALSLATQEPEQRFLRARLIALRA
jgi:RNA polymerase sigma-70 factor (ECF subfamily)